MFAIFDEKSPFFVNSASILRFTSDNGVFGFHISSPEKPGKNSYFSYFDANHQS